MLSITVAVSGCDLVETAGIRRAAKRVAGGANPTLRGDDALHVVLCGTGSPMPDPTRAASCTAVIANDQLFLVDVGPGSWENVQRWRLPSGQLAAVLLTHFHSDHIGDLGEAVMQSWALGRAEPLQVYGPPGVSEVVSGFQQAYGLDSKYRVAHHGAEVMPPSGGLAMGVEVSVPDEGTAPVFETGGVRVTAFRVDHAPVAPAVGYRFEYRGRSVVVSGDTKRSEAVQAAARGADLLVHEVLATHITNRVAEALEAVGETRLSKIMFDIAEYHTTPAEAVGIGEAAGVQLVVFSHVVPPLENRIARRAFMRAVPEKAGVPSVLGEDGMHFLLPADSDTVISATVGG